MFSRALLENRDAIKDGLRGPYLVIRDALEPDKAERLHAELAGTARWERQSVTQRNFRYQRQQIRIGSGADLNDVPASLVELYRFLTSAATLQWAHEVSGRRCVDFMGGAALYGHGDGISLHNDFMPHDGDHGGKLIRAMTFNYYLTKEWRPEWGGTFVWDKPRATIVPEFNTLVLFLVGPRSLHWVEPVADNVPAQRLAITGWFMRRRDVPRRRLQPR